MANKYVASGQPSPECLVTLVIKMDLRGWLGERSPMAWALSPFGWTYAIVNSFLEPMLMSVISLRDKVEQDRFVVKPFSMGQQSDPEQYARSTTCLMRQCSNAATLRSSNSVFQAAKLQGLQPNSPVSVHAAATAAAIPSAQASLAAAAEAAGVALPAGAAIDPAQLEAGCSPLGTCNPKYWSCPGAAGFKLRGASYLKDKKKVLADEPIFALASVDLVEVDQPTFNIGQHLPAIRDSQAPFTFVVQLMVPGPPYLSLTMAWAADYDPCAMTPSHTHHLHGHGSPRPSGHEDSDSELKSSPFDLCLARFLAGDDAEAVARRHRGFKLIPSVVKGSWVIKQSVGNTPVLLGKKLTTKYFRGPSYFEVDVDVGSSRAAASVVGLVSGATTSLCIDMAILLEGHTEEELPERLLGTVRFDQIDLKTAAYLDKERGKIHPHGSK
jgi:hypothetical protein